MNAEQLKALAASCANIVTHHVWGVTANKDSGNIFSCDELDALQNSLEPAIELMLREFVTLSLEPSDGLILKRRLDDEYAIMARCAVASEMNRPVMAVANDLPLAPPLTPYGWAFANEGGGWSPRDEHGLTVAGSEEHA